MPLPWEIADQRASLNYSQPEQLLRHRDLLTAEQIDLLQINLDRIERHPDKFGSEAYKIDSSLIAMCDVAKKVKICRCGIPNQKNPSGRCSQPRFCEYCADCRQNRSLRRFRYCLSRGAWCHATLSWKGFLLLEPPHDLQRYWEACTQALKAMVASGWIGGAYWAEQLHLEMLWPYIQVNPHVHALLNSRSGDDFGDALEEEFCGRMSGYVGPGGIDGTRVEREADVKLKPVESREHLHNCLRYFYHPADLSHVYVRNWQQARAVSTVSICDLNRNLEQYFYALEIFTHRRHTVGYAGNMDAHRRREYIGSR
jgi:hypothetical protein